MMERTGRELVASFSRGFRSRFRGEPRRIGIENEFPIVGPTGEAVDAGTVGNLFQSLRARGFIPRRDPATGQVNHVERPTGPSGGVDGSTRDVVESELGYCTLEVALAPQTTLFEAERCSQRLLTELTEELDQSGHRLLGYGMQPLTPPSRSLVAPKERFVIYDRRSRSDRSSSCADIHLFTVAAADQCHVDVSLDEAVTAVNTLGALAGLQLALTANSPVWRGEVDPTNKAVRETFYDILYGTRGDGGHRTFGILPRFHDLADYLSHLCHLEAMMVMRDGRHVEILDDLSIGELLSHESTVAGRTSTGEPVAVEPRDDDVLFLASRLESNVRLSPRYGTLESRISCQQPPGEMLVVPALILGLLENLSEAETLVASLPHEAWEASRLEAARRGLEAQIADNSAVELAQELLRIAKTGIERRGFGEEIFLAPLERRLATRRAPADNAIEAFRAGGVSELIERLTVR